MESFKESGTYTKQAHVHLPERTYEEEHGRDGFFGRVSQLYHQNPCTNWTNIEGDLRPHCFPALFATKEQDWFELLLHNNDVAISLGKQNKNLDNFKRNADGDELYFIHEGEGRVETVYGEIPYKKGDYLIIPRGTTYKFYLKGGMSTKFLHIESKSEFEQPQRGLLGPNALYDQTAIFIPKAAIGTEQDRKQYIIEVKKNNSLTKLTYNYNPLDVVGWKGSVYPWRLSIYDICPIMSHRYHIPPSGHTTLVCKNFVVCSFVARPLEDSKEGVLKVPFYHSNIDFDEVLFYHEGNFFSRDNIDAGAITFHPQGIHHGPHPNAIKKSEEKLFTDEFAVMIDTKNNLIPSAFFLNNAIKDYWQSWGLGK